MAVLFECALLSVAIWPPLVALPHIPVGSIQKGLRCDALTASSFLMTGCTLAIALLVMAVPLLITILFFLARRYFGLQLRNLAVAIVPEPARFLLVPAIVTLIFGLGWTYVHDATAAFLGILPQLLFPAVVGMFSFAISEYQVGLRRTLGGFMRVRDHSPYWLRVFLCVAIPTLVAYRLMANGELQGGAFKQQLVALGAMIIALLLLMPRAAHED